MKPKVLIVAGFPRSGTTVTSAVIDTHPEISITDEQSFMYIWRMFLSFIKVREKPADYLTVTPADHDIIKRLMDKHLAEVIYEYHKVRKPQAKIVGDKLPFYLTYLDWFRERFDCKFIITYRNKEDTMKSMEKLFSNLDKVAITNIYKASQYHFDLNQGKQDCHFVKLEKLRKNPEKTFKGIADFLEVEPAFDLSMIR